VHCAGVKSHLKASAVCNAIPMVSVVRRTPDEDHDGTRPIISGSLGCMIPRHAAVRLTLHPLEVSVRCIVLRLESGNPAREPDGWYS
jgi:hypothetical protein